MRVLIDECVHPRVREAFPNHNVVTVVSSEWRGLPDNQLIAAVNGKIDVFATVDRGFQFRRLSRIHLQ